MFWLGTLPILTILGNITRLLSLKTQSYIPRLTNVLLIVAGISSIYFHTAYSHTAHVHHTHEHQIHEHQQHHQQNMHEKNKMPNETK